MIVVSSRSSRGCFVYSVLSRCSSSNVQQLRSENPRDRLRRSIRWTGRADGDDYLVEFAQRCTRDTRLSPAHLVILQNRRYPIAIDHEIIITLPHFLTRPC